MATVQRVTGPSVQQDALPGARVTARLDSGYADGIVRGVQQLGGAVGQIVEREQAAADTASVLEARRKLSDWERSWFDPNNEKGVYSKKGRDALGLEDEVTPDFDRVTAELSGGLRSDKARAAFGQMAEGQRDSVLGRVQSYAVREHEGYVQAEFKASILNSTDMAARAAMEGRYGDQAAEAELGLKALRSQAAIMGESVEVTRLKEQEFLSTIHATAINGMLGQGNIEEALKYMDSNGDDLSASSEAEIRSRMNPLMLDSMVDKVEESINTGGAMPEGAMPVQGAATNVKEADGIAVASVGRVIKLESGGNATAKNPRSSATGAAQFVDGTWMTTISKYAPHLTQGKSRSEILAMRNDPKLSMAMAQEYAKENARFLFASGLPVTEQTVYMAHHFGAGGAAKILRAPPNTPMKQLVTPEAYAANKYLHGMTVAQVTANHEGRAGGKGKVTSTAVATSGTVSVPASGQVLVPTGLSASQAMRERAKETPNVLLRRKLEARADQMDAQAERSKRDYDRQMTEGIWAKVGNGGALDPAEKAYARDNRLEGAIESERKRQIEGTIIQDNPKLVDALHREALDNPTGFKNRVMATYSDQLTPETREKFLKMQTDADKPEKRADWRTNDARVSSMMVSLGYDNVGSAKDNVVAMNAVRSQWDMAEQAYIEKHGEKPSHEVAERMMATIKRQFLDDKDQVRKVTRASEYGFDVSRNLRGGDVERAREMLKKRTGKNPTENEIRSTLILLGGQ